MKFKVLKQDKQTNARAGSILTDHGEISTPIFIPVGTAGTVKAVHQRELEELIRLIKTAPLQSKRAEKGTDIVCET